MTVLEYTTVVGVDRKHLRQLSWVWPTWRRHKPSLLSRPMIVFRDVNQVSEAEVRSVVDHPDLSVPPWPPPAVNYSGIGEDKWTGSQRYKLLAGFVFIPAMYVVTPYWLKLDTDTIATGRDDWIDPGWFADGPAVVSAPWSFTKPADQMLKLDRWVEEYRDASILMQELNEQHPLNLAPKPGWSRVKHQRIISWCAFFATAFTRSCAFAAHKTVGPYQLPVPSQDGFMWYVAKRLGLGIVRTGMKGRGWKHRSTDRNVCLASEEAMK